MAAILFKYPINRVDFRFPQPNFPPIIKIADVAREICCVAKPKVQQEKSLFEIRRGVGAWKGSSDKLSGDLLSIFE